MCAAACLTFNLCGWSCFTSNLWVQKGARRRRERGTVSFIISTSSWSSKSQQGCCCVCVCVWAHQVRRIKVRKDDIKQINNSFQFGILAFCVQISPSPQFGQDQQNIHYIEATMPLINCHHMQLICFSHLHPLATFSSYVLWAFITGNLEVLVYSFDNSI